MTDEATSDGGGRSGNGAGPVLPPAFSVGARIEAGDRAFVIVESEPATATERRYRVREEADEAQTYWLRQAAAGGEEAPFAREVAALEKVHRQGRFCILPRVEAEARDDERGHLLVQERRFGPSLADRWELLTDPQIRALTFEQLFLALSKLHRLGYAVTNLRPEAIVAEESGDIQVVDLSALTRCGQAPDRVEESPYQAPELLSGLAADERSDVFSLGVLFAAAWMGRLVASQEELLERLERMNLRQPILAQMLQGALSEPGERFASVDEMRVLVYQLKNELARFARPAAAISSTVGVCRFRYINEDSAGFQELSVQYQSRPQHLGFYCVADGMGGHELGERASQLAVLGALQAYRQITEQVSFEELYAGLADLALTIGRAASEVVCGGAEQISGGPRMGTTFTGVLVLNDELALTHVGDTRALLVRAGECVPLSVDHSLVESMVRAGKMTLEEAAVSDERNVLLRCIDAHVPMDEGDFDGLTAVGIESGRLSVRQGDIVLVMSDGVWGVLDEEQLLEHVNGQGAQAIADGIVGAALASGSQDNATVLALVWA